jgi:RNA polymerase sigma-70 factor, ECF subfamily
MVTAVPSPLVPDAAVEGTAGECPAFADVYRTYFAFVWRSTRAHGVGNASLDDVVQEIFLVVHKRLGDFEGRSSLRTWLSGIVLNVVRRHRRTTQRRSPHELAKEDPIQPDDLRGHESDPFEALAQAEQARILQDILHDLDEPKRDVLVLAELEGLTVPEIASVLEINPNTARSRLALARQEFDKKASIRRRAFERGVS